MKEKLQQIYTQHKRWLLPLIVGISVFLISQLVLVSLAFFTDNPLPQVENYTPKEATQTAPEFGSINAKDLTARVYIPKIEAEVPITWSESKVEEDLQRDLDKGALRYPGTVEPGNFGNSFITAHSSDYPWKEGDYKQAFAKLGDLEVGDQDIFVIYSQDGRDMYKAQFRVTGKEVVKPTDIRMIEQRDKTEMTLVTCWPIGTAWRRLMVQTELVGIETL